MPVCTNNFAARMLVAYLLLGSNVGDRAAWLAHGRTYLTEKAGRLLAQSKVYETEAWGLRDQPPFLNQAIALDCDADAHALLECIRALEADAQRERAERWGPRTLDADILLFGDEVISEPHLTIPHPALPDRRFALAPLADIAQEVVHPVLHETIEALLRRCPDALEVKPVAEGDARAANAAALPHRYVALEGNIGAGKTTLANALATHYGARLVLEEFAHNDFLPKFYAEPARYAFPLELSFLADRYKQLKELLAVPELFAQNIISDYSFFKSLLFAKNNLEAAEYELYQRLFDIIVQQIPRPDLLIYLDAPVDTLRQRIAQRGRSYEQAMPDAYLESLQAAYRQLLREHQVPVIIIDTTRFRPDDAAQFAELIAEMERPGAPALRHFPAQL